MSVRINKFLSFVLLCGTLASGHAIAQTTPTVTAFTPNDGNILNQTGVQPVQGACPNNVGQAPTALSTVSCPGLSNVPMNFSYNNNGLIERCLYIDNAVNQSFFVPMRTQTEWLAFKNATINGQLIHKVGLSYGCRAQTLTDACSNNQPLPDARDLTRVTGADGTIYTCHGAPGCGEWTASNCAAPPLTLDFTLKACTTGYQPVDIMLVLDASSSMSSLISSAQAALRTIVNNYLSTRDNARVGLTVLGGSGYSPTVATSGGSSCHIGTPRPIGSALNDIVTTINAVRDGSNTPLGQAITSATSQLTPSAERRAAMIVLSDGVANCGDTDMTNNVNAAKAKGITMFGIAYGNSAKTSNFTSFNTYRNASQSDAVYSALNDYINSITSTACVGHVDAYAPGDRTTVLGEADSGGKLTLKPGNYDFVLSYCGSSQTLANQSVTSSGPLDYDFGCATP